METGHSITHLIDGSDAAYRKSLDLLSSQSTDVSCLSSTLHEYFPFGNYKESSNPIEIIVTPSQSMYTSLRDSKLLVTCKLVKTDGTDIASDAASSVCFNFFHALWSDVEILINGSKITQCSNDNPYRGWIYNLLNYSEDAKTSVLSSQMWFPNVTDTYVENTNAAHGTRVNYTAASKIFQVYGPLVDAVSTQGKMLPPNTEIRIRLKQSPTRFHLEGSTAPTSTLPFKIQFTDIRFIVKRSLIHPQIMQEHQQALSRNQRLTYPLELIDIRNFPIQKGQLGTVSNTIHSGVLPKAIAIGILGLDSYQGHLNKSAFFFKPFDLKTCSVLIDGDNPTVKTLTLDDSETMNLQAFDQLIQSTNNSKLIGLGIDRKSFYSSGNFILFFDLVCSKGGSTFSLPRTGNLKLELQFSKALENAVNVITWSFFDSQFQLDQHLNVITDLGIN